MSTKVIIHIDRFKENFEALKDRIGENRRICVPVKADAYGHGALEIAKTSVEAGAFCLGVATVTEGTQLRKGGITAPILLFSQPDPERIPEIIESGITPFISDIWFADALNKYAEINREKLPVHIKIDTGMGRTGCLPEEACNLAKHISICPGLELTGTATHFAAADSADADDIAFTQRQLGRFKEAVRAIIDEGIDPGIIHTANSGAVILHPDSWFDMVRPGILLYGYKTAEENGIQVHYKPLTVKPVMELRTNIALIKKIKKGESVSYGRTWTAPCDTTIGVLQAGYADGLPLLVSGKWQVVINGKSYPLAGRICMDLCCVNLGTNSDVRRWDEAVIFGGSAPDAAELARRTGTIPYEITCNISGRLPKEYVTKHDIANDEKNQ